MCSKKSRKIHGKTPVLESLFNKAAGLRHSSDYRFSSEYCNYTPREHHYKLNVRRIRTILMTLS